MIGSPVDCVGRGTENPEYDEHPSLSVLLRQPARQQCSHSLPHHPHADRGQTVQLSESGNNFLYHVQIDLLCLFKQKLEDARLFLMAVATKELGAITPT